MVYLFPDVSNNEPVIDGAAAKQAGMAGIGFKVSEGTGFVDDRAAANRQQAEANGLPFFAYHFMDFGNGAAQAQHFIQCVQNACGRVDGVPLCIDRESGGASDVDIFIREVRQLAPRSNFFAYSAQWASDQFGQSGELAKLPLWWSNYVSGSGTPQQLLAEVTPGWFQPFGGFNSYTARQYSSSANVGGIQGCDISACFDDATFGVIFGAPAPARVAQAAAPSFPPPPPSSEVATLSPGQALSSGQAIEASVFRLVMQWDGNLVAYQKIPRWSSGTNGHPGATAAMQSDGNFVVYGTDNKPLWASNTNGHPGAVLDMQADGNLVIYEHGTALWASGSMDSPGASGQGFLTPGSRLGSGQCLPDGAYTLVMQSDGNLVVYEQDPRWSSGTNGKGAVRCAMQADGNLVVSTSSGAVVWATGTNGHPGTSLTLQGSDGNVVAYDRNHVPLWASAT